MIHHQSPIKVIKGLWGDPAFANLLVYKPAKLFKKSKQTEEEHMYSKMWMGGFWNAAQVLICISFYHNSLLTCNKDSYSSRRDYCSGNYRV